MSWDFLTNHAQVLLIIAAQLQSTARSIASRVGVTERAVQRILVDLEEGGYVSRTREGRVNVYRVDRGQPLRHPAQQGRTVGDLLRLLGEAPEGPSAPEGG